MIESHQRYPLAWPEHRPRRRAADRVRGDFKAADKRITIAAAVDRLELEIERLGGTNALLSTNIETRMDGRPRAGSVPADPGVCLYFTLKGRPVAMPCDTFGEVAQNIAALAAHIDSLRRQERYGVATTEDSLQAFMALPAPSATALGGRTIWDILGLDAPATTVEEVQAAYRAKAKQTPAAQLTALNVARDLALQTIKRGAAV